MSETSQIACSRCGLEHIAKPGKSGPKLPRGWKRKQNEVFCGNCWSEKYILRALTFPVAEIVSGGSWNDLRTELKQMWERSTALSNWAMTELYARDVRRNGLDRMPPMSPVYLYPAARQRFSSLPSQSAVSILQAVDRKYRALRYDVIWTAAKTLPSMRYPQPYPLQNRSWSLRFDDGNRPIVSARIGDTRWELRLKGGFRYRRQIAGLKRMEEQGELALLKSGDGTIFVKVVGWLKRPDRTGPLSEENTLIVRTGKDHLLSALDVEGNRIWIENCDHLPKTIAAQKRRMQRYAQDRKAEQGPAPSFARVSRQAAEKYRNRITSAVQEIAAHVAGFAKRKGYSRVLYSDAERWLDRFPYAMLRERIKGKLEELTIQFELASGDTPEAGQAPLAEE